MGIYANHMLLQAICNRIDLKKAQKRPQAGTPLQIGKKIAKNRITMAPTVKFYASDDGMVTEEYVRHYAERAAHQCGLIVVEATCIAEEARLDPRQLGLWNDEQIEGHKRLVEAVHQHGALVIPQIHHGGLATHPECGPLTSPTKVIWNHWGKAVEAVELTHEDVKKVISQFVEAAVRAKKAGYDGVQLHACHSYLINDFASEVNQRTDEYGGSVENRARFGAEIIEEIRKACGEDFIISARISGSDPNYEDALEVAECYVKAGCDFLQVSGGIHSLEDMEYDESLPFNRTAALGVLMHEHFKGRVPVSAVNGFSTPDEVRYMFDHELVDAVDLGRGLLADPAFTEAILEDAPYARCLHCPECAFGPGHTHPCPAMKQRGVADSTRF